MSNFNIRVELHDANAFHYRTLEEGLSRCGITDIIQGSNGRRKLPTGLYTVSAIKTSEQVLENVKAAATATGRQFEAVVCEGNSTWWNLRQA